ncbi:MAG: YegS/Rv2252/BmrU family lipid kinase [Flavobacteriales bacterium]|nr:YegS/Rv2252/BmrU family lipid kinase [Bacteroidota bacterium]MCB9240094.1 YegS/Rv2252/BmrU family lipid kinase [Flavobacteriales bacterium]
MRILAIGNPCAHGGEARTQIQRFKSFLSQYPEHSHRIYETSQPKDSIRMASEILEFDPDIISIIGGDGTINDVINVPEARSKILHLIPAGSGNDFSHLINGRITEKESFELVFSPNRRTVDCGQCNHQYFLNGVGIGFDGSIARETVRMKLPFSTSWKYWIAIFKHVLFYRSTPISIQWESNKVEEKLFMISIANGREYGGGFRVSPESDPDDGSFNLVLVKALHPLKRLFQIPVVEKGRHLKKSFVVQHLVKNVVLTSSQPMHAHLDGEIMISNRFEILYSGKLTLVV